MKKKHLSRRRILTAAAGAGLIAVGAAPARAAASLAPLELNQTAQIQSGDSLPAVALDCHRQLTPTPFRHRSRSAPCVAAVGRSGRNDRPGNDTLPPSTGVVSAVKANHTYDLYWRIAPPNTDRMPDPPTDPAYPGQLT